MVKNALQSDHLLVRLGVAFGAVFVSLYALDSFGVPGMTLVALLIGAGVLLAYHDKTAQEAGTAAGRKIRV